ncbi:MAG: alpha/beta fold hydrolase [Myxococcota bacterium]
MRSVRHIVDNGVGWHLSLSEAHDSRTFDPGLAPVLIVPGYGMNSFIFGYHPDGESLEAHLIRSGFEVWKADLRGQGSAVRLKGSRRFGLKDLALTDLDAILRAVRERTRSKHHRVHVIGASLGGTLMMTHAVIRGADAYASMVTMGSPIRWVDVHPLVKVAFRSPALAGAVSIRGTRRLATALLPVLAEHAPSLLSMYLNPAITDTAQAEQMAKTVEDPSRHLNREIAAWIQQKDLVIEGINVAEGLRAIRAPFLCIAASADGVVPVRTAEFAYQQVGSPQKTLIQAGAGEVKMAHADLFVSREAKARVFEPMSTWLRHRH